MIPEERFSPDTKEKQTLKKNVILNLPGIIDTVIGTVAAMLFPMENITEFLYFIGSIFAPMISVQIADNFILGHKNEDRRVDITAGLAWIVGFIVYRFLMKTDMVFGYTIPDMAITVVVTIVFRKLSELSKSHSLRGVQNTN